jgi:Fe-S-cluster-containing dehydrogenase component
MNPACVPVCPVGAIWRDAETGLVPLDAEACIGCGACVTACPYAARTMDPISNLPVKCTLCTQLLDEGKLPSCVKHCIAQARFYGDLDDPDSDSARYLAEPGSSRELHLMESQGTGPSVAYLEPAVGMLSADVPLTLTQGL